MNLILCNFVTIVQRHIQSILWMMLLNLCLGWERKWWCSWEERRTCESITDNYFYYYSFIFCKFQKDALVMLFYDFLPMWIINVCARQGRDGTPGREGPRGPEGPTGPPGPSLRGEKGESVRICTFILFIYLSNSFSVTIPHVSYLC